jgi:hypothetical protein
MPRVSQTIEFEGYFAEGVLGIFKIIRGFADLRDLAAVSVPYELSDAAEPGRVVGHQRQLDEKHALDIKKYLEQSDNRLIPEVILSVRGVFNTRPIRKGLSALSRKRVLSLPSTAVLAASTSGFNRSKFSEAIWKPLKIKS